MAAPRGIERFSLEGRVVLITGARGGLGLEMARGMAAAGALVGINGRDAALAEQAAAGIPNAFPAPFDITDLAAAARGIDTVMARHGRLDCLVNNAALRDRRPFQEIAADDLRRLLETNLVAAYEVSRLAARYMEGRGGGRLTFITSMVGPQSFQGDPAYTGPQAAELGRRIPLRRWGRPDELVGPAIFLASDAASYVNGHVLTVDAGLSIAL